MARDVKMSGDIFTVETGYQQAHVFAGRRTWNSNPRPNAGQGRAGQGIEIKARLWLRKWDVIANLEVESVFATTDHRDRLPLAFPPIRRHRSVRR